MRGQIVWRGKRNPTSNPLHLLGLFLCLHSLCWRRSIRKNLRTHSAVREKPKQAPDQHTERSILLDARESSHYTACEGHEARHEAQLPCALALEILVNLRQACTEKDSMLARVQRFEQLCVEHAAKKSGRQSAVQRRLQPNGGTGIGRVVIDQRQTRDALRQNKHELAVSWKRQLLEQAVREGNSEPCHFKLEGGDAQTLNALVLHDHVNLGQLQEDGGQDDGVPEHLRQQRQDTILRRELMALNRVNHARQIHACNLHLRSQTKPTKTKQNKTKIPSKLGTDLES